MSLEVRLIRVAPLGGIKRNETITELVVTPHNLFDVMAEVTRVAHETMVADQPRPVPAVCQDCGKEQPANFVSTTNEPYHCECGSQRFVFTFQG